MKLVFLGIRGYIEPKSKYHKKHTSLKAPSTKKSVIVTYVAMLSLGFATYYNLHPIITVGLASITETAAKTLLRRAKTKICRINDRYCRGFCC